MRPPVLLPLLLDKHIRHEDDLTDHLQGIVNCEKMKNRYREFDGSVHYGDLVENETMDDFCDRLKGVNAVWHAAIDRSPEVVKSGLLEQATA